MITLIYLTKIYFLKMPSKDILYINNSVYINNTIINIYTDIYMHRTISYCISTWFYISNCIFIIERV